MGRQYYAIANATRSETTDAQRPIHSFIHSFIKWVIYKLFKSLTGW